MWKQTQLRGNSTCAQSGCFGRMSFGTYSTSFLCSGSRSVRVSFKPSAASLCVETFPPWCLSGGCLPTELAPMEELHPPTSGATASNSPESEKRQSNRATGSPRLARSTMVRSESTDADGYAVLTFEGEVTAVSAFRPRGSSPSVAVSHSMADIGSAYQAAGFPEEATNVLPA